MTSSAGSCGGSTAIGDVRTITLANNKGGSGKTTTTVNVAAAFAERGFRVLVVDLDPQGSTTEWLGGHESPTGLVEFSAGGMRVAQLVRRTAHGVDLIPASPGLVASGESRQNETGLAIVRAFARLPDFWDIVVIDTPPTLGYLSLAPLVASDRVVIPVEAHALALPGVASAVESIESARRSINKGLQLMGIVACRVRATRHTREVIARLRAEYGAIVLDSTVRESTQVAEAPSLQMPITAYAPSSRVANDYRAVAAELLDRMGDAGS